MSGGKVMNNILLINMYHNYIFINMILDDFKIDVIEESPKIRVNYSNGDYSGSCTYERIEKKGINKPIRQTILILTESNMGNVIDYWNDRVPLSDGDVNMVSTMIREHSRRMAMNYLSSPDLHQ